MTFKAAAERYITAHKAGWKNAKLTGTKASASISTGTTIVSRSLATLKALDGIGRVIDFSVMTSALCPPSSRHLFAVSIPVAFLRAAWFIENAAWDVAAACEGQIRS
jgi:hypothetical protein